MPQTTHSRALQCRRICKFTCDIYFLALIPVFQLDNNLSSCSRASHLFLIKEESEFLLDAIFDSFTDAEKSVDRIYVKQNWCVQTPQDIREEAELRSLQWSWTSQGSAGFPKATEDAYDILFGDTYLRY